MGSNMRRLNTEKDQHRHAGFTLLELLVVVALVGLLVALTISNIQYARARARDTRRVQDARTLLTAIELYRADTNKLPDNPTDLTAGDNTGGFDVGNPGFRSNHIFLKQLIDAGALKQPIVDVDTQFLNDHSYRYFKYSNFLCGSGSYGVLGFRLEHAQAEYKITDDVQACYANDVAGLWTKDDRWLAFMIPE